MASIFRLKRTTPTPIPQLAITTVGGLQMRSTSAEVNYTCTVRLQVTAVEAIQIESLLLYIVYVGTLYAQPVLQFSIQKSGTSSITLRLCTKLMG